MITLQKVIIEGIIFELLCCSRSIGKYETADYSVFNINGDNKIHQKYCSTYDGIDNDRNIKSFVIDRLNSVYTEVTFTNENNGTFTRTFSIQYPCFKIGL